MCVLKWTALQFRCIHFINTENEWRCDPSHLDCFLLFSSSSPMAMWTSPHGGGLKWSIETTFPYMPDDWMWRFNNMSFHKNLGIFSSTMCGFESISTLASTNHQWIVFDVRLEFHASKCEDTMNKRHHIQFAIFKFHRTHCITLCYPTLVFLCCVLLLSVVW